MRERYAKERNVDGSQNAIDCVRIVSVFSFFYQFFHKINRLSDRLHCFLNQDEMRKGKEIER